MATERLGLYAQALKISHFAISLHRSFIPSRLSNGIQWVRANPFLESRNTGNQRIFLTIKFVSQLLFVCCKVQPGAAPDEISVRYKPSDENL